MTTETLWDFACRVYGAPGVAAACLVLQDEAGVDVPLLLWCAWAAARGAAPDRAAITAAAAAVAPWRDATVRPLRMIRRAMKADLGADHAAAAALRERVKASELEAERLQLLMLEARPLPPASGRPTADAIVAALEACLGVGWQDRVRPIAAAAAAVP
ncbi:MAG: TIGR02444 family protein [Alphaproteobacteria bacterium]